MGISLKGFGDAAGSGTGASVSGISALPPAAAIVRLPDNSIPLPPPTGSGTLFAKWIGGTFDDIYTDTVSDSVGNLYAWGYSKSFDTDWPGTYSDLILSKWSNDGVLQWTKKTGKSGKNTSAKIFINNAGELITIFNVPQNYYPSIVKWDTDGNKIWAKEIPLTFTYCTDAVIMANDDIYVSGQRKNSTNYYAMIWKWDTNGNVIDSKGFTQNGTNNSLFNGVAKDSTGALYAVGNHHNAYDNDSLIIKFTSTFGLIWYKQIDTSANDHFEAIDIDTNDNIFAVGTSRSLGTANGNAFVSKWDASGTMLWSKYLSGSTYSQAYDCAVDGVGNIYAVGLTIDPNPGVGMTSFIAKWDSSGVLQWNKYLNTGETSMPKSINIDTLGNVIVTAKATVSGVNQATIIKLYQDGSSNLALGTSGETSVDTGFTNSQPSTMYFTTFGAGGVYTDTNGTISAVNPTAGEQGNL